MGMGYPNVVRSMTKKLEEGLKSVRFDKLAFHCTDPLQHSDIY